MKTVQYLSVTETAGLLGISRQAVRSLCKRGRLKAIKIGKQWAIKCSAAEKRKTERSQIGPSPLLRRY